VVEIENDSIDDDTNESGEWERKREEKRGRESRRDDRRRKM
jgi:hypothetical protein